MFTRQVYKSLHVNYKLLMLIKKFMRKRSFIQTDCNGKKLLLLVNFLKLLFAF